MRDSINNPLLFQKYFGDFYGRIFNYWYWLVAQRHSEPIYVAIDEIKKEDPIYFKMITEIVNTPSSSEVKVQLASKICDYLFK